MAWGRYNKNIECLIPHFECSMYYQTMRCADFIVKEPMVIGHECAGIIEEVGGEVKTLEPGDRVALEPGISCWRCGLCKEGRYNLCPEMKFFATPPVHGSLANQVKVCGISYYALLKSKCRNILDYCFNMMIPQHDTNHILGLLCYNIWSFVKAYWLVQF